MVGRRRNPLNTDAYPEGVPPLGRSMTYQDDDENEEHRFDHPQCGRCWFEEWGVGKMPVRIPRPLRLTCCFCGGPTMSGIFRRVEPASFKIPFCPDLTVDPVPILPETRRLGR